MTGFHQMEGRPEWWAMFDEQAAAWCAEVGPTVRSMVVKADSGTSAPADERT